VYSKHAEQGLIDSLQCMQHYQLLQWHCRGYRQIYLHHSQLQVQFILFITSTYIPTIISSNISSFAGAIPRDMFHALAVVANTLADSLEEGVASVGGEFFFAGAGACTLDNLLTSVGREGVDGGVERRLCHPCTSLSALRARWYSWGNRVHSLYSRMSYIISRCKPPKNLERLFLNTFTTLISS
jgi:hypothetical protein